MLPANGHAARVIEALDAASAAPGAGALLEYFIVRPWIKYSDCYWNIAGLPYVYNNQRLWRHIYNANKNALPDPSNQNIITPCMKLKIPSLSGEKRSGIRAPFSDRQTPHRDMQLSTLSVPFVWGGFGRGRSNESGSWQYEV